MGEIQEVKVDKSVWKRANWAREAALEVVSNKDGWEAESRIDEVRFCLNGYAEPGYTEPECGIIASADWNSVTKYNRETGKSDEIDDTICRLGVVLEKLGVELHWSDQWTECHECCRFIRTSPDSYSWSPSYYVGDGFICCFECLDKEEYLEEIEGGGSCNTAVEDPSKHGYHYVASFEAGLYGGQDASPELIAKVMREASFYRFIFHLEYQGQFDSKFALYLHEEEALPHGGLDRAKIAVGEGQTDGPSRVEAMKRGFEEVTKQTAELRSEADETGGILVSSIGPDGATTKVVSREDFLAGNALKDDEK